MINKFKSRKGFTLIELLVVIETVGILAVVAVPALFKNINKAKVSKLESTYNTVKSATLSYYTDKNELPNNIKDLIDGSIDDENMQAQTGGIYKIYKKGNDGKISTRYGEVKVHEIKNNGSI